MSRYKKIKIPFLIGLSVVVLLGVFFITIVQKQSTIFPRNNSLPDISFQELNNKISIGDTKIITEQYLSGSYPEIKGKSPVAVSAREYIQRRINEDAAFAADEVPEFRTITEDSTRTYGLEIQAEYLSSINTDSIVLIESQYIGGANTRDSFTSFTQNNDGELIELSDLVTEIYHAQFINDLQEKLLNYSIDGVGPVTLFSDTIDRIRFEDINQFAISDEDLILYFDKGFVGPGAIGPVIITFSNYETTLNSYLNEAEFTTDRRGFYWSLEDTSGEDTTSPETTLVLVMQTVDGQERITVDTINAGCRELDEPISFEDGQEVEILPSTKLVQCYYAGNGAEYRINVENEKVLVERKFLEEPHPEFDTPDYEFETLIEL
ncbi:MAG: hypothetical protein MRY57_02110 [Candidatus Pacebacteria bacterium]|nr:hypothetical protein [Candidatus Paceibacterota bacterium]